MAWSRIACRRTRAKDPERPLVFNMSLAGGTPLCELLLLKRVLAAGIHPRWVVIEVLPPSLNSEDKILASPDPVTPSRIRWSDLDVLDRHAPKSSWHRYRKWLATCLVPCFSNRYCLLSRYAASWLEPAKTTQVIFWRTCLTPCGWLPYPVKVVTPELRKRWLQRTRDEYTDMLANFRVAPEADRLFREMLQTCRHEGIQVIGLLRMPEGTEFKRLYSPEATQCIDSYLHDLCRQEHTELIDASNWLDDDCFADGHHLLPPGAKRFTLRLWNEVLKKHVERGSSSSLALSRGSRELR